MLTATLVLGAAAALMAKVPPPPVNQTLGFYDTKFGALVETDCRGCHGASLVDRHHALINSVVPAVSCIRQPSQPASLTTGCHVLISDGTGGFVFQDFRNCLNCHTASPHHTTTAALAKDCQHCHGSVIDNPGDGHFIPAYPMSSVTPLPGGTVASPTDSRIVHGCQACHQADATATPKPIFSNKDTHHGTGLGATDVTQCTWCHDTTPGAITIRQCESCHGVKSLHNIQVNTPATANPTTIVPGAETAGYGHIGANWDCNGCHWNWYSGSSAPFTSATVPMINSQSVLVAHVGQATNFILNGSSFTNLGTDGVTAYNPTVTISNGTTTLTLQPFSITESEIKVLVPALLQGIYDVRVIKEGVQSNKATLTVVPDVQLNSAVLGSRTSVTITGKNFGAAPPAGYTSGLGVFAGDQPAKIVSWSNSKIVASSSNFRAGSAIAVRTINGAVSGTISGATKKTR